MPCVNNTADALVIHGGLLRSCGIYDVARVSLLLSLLFLMDGIAQESVLRFITNGNDCWVCFARDLCVRITFCLQHARDTFFRSFLPTVKLLAVVDAND